MDLTNHDQTDKDENQRDEDMIAPIFEPVGRVCHDPETDGTDDVDGYGEEVGLDAFVTQSGDYDGEEDGESRVGY